MTGYLGKVRAYVVNIADETEKKANVYKDSKWDWEIIEIHTFDEGLISDFDKDGHPHGISDRIQDEEDIILDALLNDKNIENVKSDDYFEIIGDYHCDSGYSSYDGEYDYESWLENVKVHKLTERQQQYCLREQIEGHQKKLEEKIQRKALRESRKLARLKRPLDLLVD